MKKNKSRKKLEGLVKEGRAYCGKHNEKINLSLLYYKKCYLHRSRKRYCRYVIIK